MNKKLLTILLSVLLPAFLVSAVVYATTSIGDDITVEDALTVTGATTLNGNVTLGNGVNDILTPTGYFTYLRVGTSTTFGDIGVVGADELGVEGDVEIDGAVYLDGAVDMDSTLDVAGAVTLSGTVATGLTFTGTYATAAIQLGTSASKMTLTAADDHTIDVWTTNSLTSGTVRSVDISQTHTGAGAIAEALTSTLTSDVAIGSWGNAIFGKVDLLTNGYTTGQLGVICAELTFAGSAATAAGGDYVLYQAEIILPASADMGSRPIHVLDVHAQGTQKAEFDTVGYLFEVGGVTPAAGKVVSLTSQTIRAKIETASPVADLTRYLVLSQMEDGLGLGVSGTPMVLTAASNRAVDIYTTTALTSGTVRSVEINQTHTGTGGAIAEAFTSILTSDVKIGSWGNAIFGKMDLSTNGYVTGLAGAICGELDMPGSTFSQGTYAVFQAELNCAANSSGYANPTSFMIMNAWGDATALSAWQADGYIFHLTGLGAATDGEVFDTIGNVTPTHQLRILIDGVEYFIMLQATQ